MHVALTIAGSDSSGGAGIQADLKTFSAFRIYGASVITAVTAQNTQGVDEIHSVPSGFVTQQIDSVCKDIKIAGIKTGMFYTSETIEAVCDRLKFWKVPIVVVDPVMMAKDGSLLLQESALEILISKLFPLATLVTPNRFEAEKISNFPIHSEKDVERAAKVIYSLGCKAVLIKGGHLEGDPIDILFDGERTVRFPGIRVRKESVHGTGCTLASAILSGLILGKSMEKAIHWAKMYVARAIETGIACGHGALVLNHFIDPFTLESP